MKHAKIITVLSLGFALLVGLPLAAQTATTPTATTPAATTATTPAATTATTPTATTATAPSATTAPATTAATTPEVGTPNPAGIGVDTAQQKLKEVSVDKFEEEGFWVASMSPDEGFITDRLFIGSPAGKANDPLPDERLINNNNAIPDTHVLGVRVEYLHRGNTEFEIRASKPLPVEGITKTISVWVVGRNYDNELQVIISDYFGHEYDLSLGTLNFQGWKKLTVAVPPQSVEGSSGVIQRDYHYNEHMGIKIVGFRVLCDPTQDYGSYYIYFDDLRAVTDLFAEDNRDPDDMSDSW